MMKQSEIKEMTTQELSDRLVEEQSNINKLEMTHAVSPLENPLTIRSTRRTIARIKTEFTKRALDA